MKNLILPVLLAGYITVFAKDNVTIHGHIEHQLADSIKISYTLLSSNYTHQDYKAKLDHGDFSISFTVPKGYTELTITNGPESTELIVEPGADLALTIDAANFDNTLHYEGKGKEIANYLAKCIAEKHSFRYVNTKAQMLGNNEPAEYPAALKKLVEEETLYLQNNGKDLPESFREYVLKANQYEIWYTMHMYSWRQESKNKQSATPKNNTKEIYAVIEGIPAVFNDDYLTMGSYREYIHNYIYMQFHAEMIRKDLSIPIDAIQDTIFARSVKMMPPKTAEFQLGQTIYNSLQKKSLEAIIHDYKRYRAQYPNSKNLAVLEAGIDQKRLTGPGKPEIDFDITTPDGKQMKLSDLKGKVVYIDFWERGCVPCIAEMADAKKVRAHFMGKPVAFVYVSLDEDDAIWKGAVKTFTSDGINTHLEKGKESDVVKKYEADSIPRHYLIDKEGRFAKVDRVEYPAEKEKLIAQIESLLQ